MTLSRIGKSVIDICFIAVDAGTTNMRAWLVSNGEIIAHTNAMVGVRDTAKDKNNSKLRGTLKNLIEGLTIESYQPEFIAAAGMITSALGLRELLHIKAPAGKKQLALAAELFFDADITALPICLFPGVKQGDLQAENWCQADVMRGEETFALGLVESQQFTLPLTILNLGSHWKTIKIDEQGSIIGSRTSLAGEMIYAIQTNTILASAVMQNQLLELDMEWCQQGMREAQHAGLSRALFCVRLLELQAVTNQAQRMSFLIGAFVADEFEALRNSAMLDDSGLILTVGKGAVLEAWKLMLNNVRLSHQELLENPENYFIRGISALLSERIAAQVECDAGYF